MIPASHRREKRRAWFMRDGWEGNSVRNRMIYSPMVIGMEFAVIKLLWVGYAAL